MNKDLFGFYDETLTHVTVGRIKMTTWKHNDYHLCPQPTFTRLLIKYLGVVHGSGRDLRPLYFQFR